MRKLENSVPCGIVLLDNEYSQLVQMHFQTAALQQRNTYAHTCIPPACASHFTICSEFGLKIMVNELPILSRVCASSEPQCQINLAAIVYPEIRRKTHYKDQAC
jgi:hypothetical protein